MLLGRSVIYWVVIAFVAVVMFLLARELIPLLFGIVDVVLSATLVKLLSLLIAIGVFWYGGWGRGVVG